MKSLPDKNGFVLYIPRTFDTLQRNVHIRIVVRVVIIIRMEMFTELFFKNLLIFEVEKMITKQGLYQKKYFSCIYCHC